MKEEVAEPLESWSPKARWTSQTDQSRRNEEERADVAFSSGDDSVYEDRGLMATVEGAGSNANPSGSWTRTELLHETPKGDGLQASQYSGEIVQRYFEGLDLENKGWLVKFVETAYPECVDLIPTRIQLHCRRVKASSRAREAKNPSS